MSNVASRNEAVSRSETAENATMRAALLSLLAVTVCSTAGDPDTHRHTCESRAGFAWSGPGSLCCDLDDLENVGWQVWFTNTASCPETGEDAVLLMILTPRKVVQHLGELPEAGATVAIHPIDSSIDEPMAYRGDDSILTDPQGTLTLDAFSREVVVGSFRATAPDQTNTNTVLFDGAVLRRDRAIP